MTSESSFKTGLGIFLVVDGIKIPILTFVVFSESVFRAFLKIFLEVDDTKIPIFTFVMLEYWKRRVVLFFSVLFVTFIYFLISDSCLN